MLPGCPCSVRASRTGYRREVSVAPDRQRTQSASDGELMAYEDNPRILLDVVANSL